MSGLPLLAITLGDPAGTGPELLTKALVLPEVRALCRPLVIGDAAVLAKACAYTGSAARVRGFSSPEEAQFADGEIAVHDLKNVDLARLQLGKADPRCGHAAYEYVKTAAELALAGRVGGIVTSAINKAALNAAGHHFDGHTGLLAEVCKAPGATMMLVADKLRVSHVSTHVSLRQAIDRVRPERIVKVLQLTNAAVQRLGIAQPKLAVAGLNPHAGEGGLFGDEEEKFIKPAIEQARALGLDVSGPWPGDTIFFRASQGEFDGTVAMFHDQGHVAAKMLGIWRGVNVTLGLPIIRTSVEHGTDFANAGTGRGDPRSLVEAIKLAAALARNPSARV
ncbi:4-hydroxythreonine-4-phosphate dehydrogenase PdxA [Oleiharenicola lentus]|uniref:4-hydroxythreonine-4-phosphate dehydrogenase PdxA n=1 Tax=Oleiharenicola lentus TaxID=2508720 RepID=A0A4Q1C5D4_9BACT|nr:4-hydroxythreonine-4-phosphate dehydrogenase PdxA [Oleiharenicola lentus]RXK53640.1 4-hydroxythreonine-4-phosphate dehydrogenase PdxA [Oleiharenicola lentus]